MPRTGTASTGTDSTTVGGRLTVSLPKEIAAELQKLGQRLADEVEKHAGIRVEMSPAQVIEATVKAAVEKLDQFKADVDGDGSSGNSDSAES